MEMPAGHEVFVADQAGFEDRDPKKQPGLGSFGNRQVRQDRIRQRVRFRSGPRGIVAEDALELDHLLAGHDHSRASQVVISKPDRRFDDRDGR